MNDMDDDDLSRFSDDSDRIKPIDAEEERPRPQGMGGWPKKEEPKKEEPKQEETPQAEANEKPRDEKPSNPAPETSAGSGNPPPNPAPENWPEDGSPPAASAPPPNPVPEPGSETKPEEPAEEKQFKSNEEFLKGLDDDPLPPPRSDGDPLQGGLEVTSVDNSVAICKNEQLDLVEKAPTLKRMVIGAGWDHKAFEEEPVDVDLSIFLIDKTDMTRIDEDFIFYNNERACDGAIQHRGDSRSGAGDGDDETIFLDLNGIPFDILKIVIVLSVYDPDYTGKHMGQVKNVFLRVVNKDDNTEIMRYRIDPEDHSGGNAIVVGILIREGPKWIYEAKADIYHQGLARIATEYGIIVKELQGTGEEVLGEIKDGVKPPEPPVKEED